MAGNAYLKLSLFWHHHHLELISYLQNQRNLSEMKPLPLYSYKLILKSLCGCWCLSKVSLFWLCHHLEHIFYLQRQENLYEMKSISDVVVLRCKKMKCTKNLNALLLRLIFRGFQSVFFKAFLSNNLKHLAYNKI